MINARVQNISAKILALYNTKKLMRIASPAVLPKITTSEVPSNHPHQTVFFDRTEILDLASEIDEGAKPAEVESNMPKLSSIELKNKLYNSRLQNNPENLQTIISGATKHIHDITKLLLSLSKYRADTMGAITNSVNQLQQSNRNQQADTNSEEGGVLGLRPANVTSVAELMLFDTSTNVYEDRSVNFIQETGAVFNIRGKKQRILSKKEKQQIEQQKLLQIRKKAIVKEQEAKKTIAAAPASFNQNNQIKYRYATNEFQYVGAQQDEDVEIGLKDKLHSDDDSGDDDDDDLTEFFAKNKKADQQKKMNMTNALSMAQQDNEMSMMNPNSSRMDRSVNFTPVGDDGETMTAIETIPEGEEGEDGEPGEDGEETRDQ